MKDIEKIQSEIFQRFKIKKDNPQYKNFINNIYIEKSKFNGYSTNSNMDNFKYNYSSNTDDSQRNIMKIIDKYGAIRMGLRKVDSPIKIYRHEEDIKQKNQIDEKYYSHNAMRNHIKS